LSLCPSLSGHPVVFSEKSIADQAQSEQFFVKSVDLFLPLLQSFIRRQVEMRLIRGLWARG
jgi:hypothetical protein